MIARVHKLDYRPRQPLLIPEHAQLVLQDVARFMISAIALICLFAAVLLGSVLVVVLFASFVIYMGEVLG